MSFGSGLGGAMSSIGGAMSGIGTGMGAAASGAAGNAGLAAALGSMRQTEMTSAAMTELTARADQRKMVTDAYNGMMAGVMDSNTKAMSSAFAAVKQLNY